MISGEAEGRLPAAALWFFMASNILHLNFATRKAHDFIMAGWT